MPADRSHAMDHVVVVLFENRSLDNVLGRLYGPEDGKTFEGVIGKELSNPIPEWAEDGAERKVVPYTVATDMDSPNRSWALSNSGHCLVGGPERSWVTWSGGLTRKAVTVFRHGRGCRWAWRDPPSLSRIRHGALRG
jgi:hypothetical protein